jgi:hypothetical protein
MHCLAVTHKSSRVHAPHFRFQRSSFAAAAGGGDGSTMLLELDSRGEMSPSMRSPGFCTQCSFSWLQKESAALLQVQDRVWGARAMQAART